MAALSLEIKNALQATPTAADRFSPMDFIVPLTTLGLMPPSNDRKAIAKAAKDKDWLKRAAAALSEGVNTGELRRLVDDESELVKQLAIHRLKVLGAK
jgi:hypothetical protein